MQNPFIVKASEKLFTIAKEALAQTAGLEARKYLEERQIYFAEVGFVSNEVVDFLFSLSELDWFAERLKEAQNHLIFPLRLPFSSQLYGFATRAIFPTKMKSISISLEQCVPFSALMYNLDDETQGKVWIVEGIADVRALKRDGKFAISTLGAKLTIEQAALIRLLNREVILCFDADKAGREAIPKALRNLGLVDIIPELAFCVDGEDPDSSVKKYLPFSIKSLRDVFEYFSQDEVELIISAYSDKNKVDFLLKSRQVDIKSSSSVLSSKILKIITK